MNFRSGSARLCLALCCLTFVACAYFDHQLVETRYPDGKTRTRYHYWKNAVDSTISFYDSAGNAAASVNTLRDWNPNSDLNYFGFDTAGCKAYDLRALNREIDRCVDSATAKRFAIANGFERGSGTFFFWIAPPGRIEHIVCRRSSHLAKEYIADFSEAMESCGVEAAALEKPVIVSKKIILSYGP